MPIDPEKFQAFCDDLKKCYLDNVGWYKLSPTLHKILEHGSQVIELFPDSITSGFLSEEPAEASNKHVKYFQKSHGQQNSAENRNKSVFNRLLDRSDPHIVHHFAKQQKLWRKNREPYPKAVLALCKDSSQLVDELLLDQ